MANYFKVANVEPENVYMRTVKNFNYGLSREEEKKYSFVAGSSLSDKCFSEGTNSFVFSTIKAYNRHHNLTIRPDDIWIAICNQFSNYVNANGEKLRSKLVDFEGKKTLEIKSGGSFFNADHVKIYAQMADKISENIKDPQIHNWITPKFSTTTPVDVMAASVCLMATFKTFFEYKVSFECNLPGVTLLGVPEDWIDIRMRANKLLEFDLENKLMTNWTNLLFPILDKFIETANFIAKDEKDKIDKNWWNRIVKYYSGGSGPSYISGWITAFSVFNTEGVYQAIDFDNGKEWPKIDTADIPHGYAYAPVKINDNGTKYLAKLIAGHMFIEQIDNNTIAPRVDWAIFVTPDND
ncbi:protein of unknown function DUF4419 [Catovirus CTV1]|uniref:DUF4419 domain-containing protein n=1 Tax=Catovirus CTV1 TaxID=1977631 RepID=A0A1V0S952_9VIRU|nr:protein of unknown function DUF4419 [Catovirus CTV1]